MKKYICVLAGAALLVACEKKTEVTTPASPAAEKSPHAHGPGDGHSHTSPTPSP